MRPENFRSLGLGILIFGLNATAAGAASTPPAAVAPSAHLPGETLKFDGIPRTPRSLEDRLQAYLGARGATDCGWSPKGELLIATRFGDSTQLHLVTRAGGERRQLTFFSDPVERAAFSPDPWHDGYVFAKDTGGNEQYQLYYQRVGAPTAHRLTADGSANGGAVWSNSGRELAFFSNKQGAGGSDVEVVSAEDGAAAHVVLAADGSLSVPLDWSPDDRRLLVRKTAAAQDEHLEIVDLGTGERRELLPGGPKAAIGAARFSRDGQGVYLISDRDSEFKRLSFLNIFSGQLADVSGAGAGDVEEFALSRDGHYLAYVRDQGGSDRLELVDLRTHQKLAPPLPSPGLVDALHFDLDGKRLAFTFGAQNHPRDAYVLDLATNRLEAWTHSEPGAVDLAKFVAPRLMHFPTFDRVGAQPREIPVYLFEPATPGPHPVLIRFATHQNSAFRPGFDPWIQFLVNELDVAVVAPNLRGSSGYGKEYASLGGVARREDVIKDIGALIIWIETRKELDPKRVVVSGRSYGGYLTLGALANFGDRLRGGVEMGASFGGGSPITYAQRIAKPMLIAGGMNDPHVPVGEAQEIVGLLRSHRIEARLLLATEEGHELLRKRDRDAYHAAFAQFLGDVMR